MSSQLSSNETLENTFTFIHIKKPFKNLKKWDLKKNLINHTVCGADILMKLQLDVTFGKPLFVMQVLL